MKIHVQSFKSNPKNMDYLTGKGILRVPETIEYFLTSVNLL